MALPLTPVSWLTALVRDSEHSHDIALNLVKDRVWKVTENMPPDRILAFRPHHRIDSKLINRLKCLGSKSIRCNRAALEVPEEDLSDFRLRLRQNFDSEANYRAISRAFASAQETALTVPARRAACRALISWRHASVIEESSLPSRLSSSAAVKAERSSAGKPRASSRMWPTWAFMQRSLALNVGPVTACAEPTPSPAFERTCAKSRAGRKGKYGVRLDFSVSDPVYSAISSLIAPKSSILSGRQLFWRRRPPLPCQRRGRTLQRPGPSGLM